METDRIFTPLAHGFEIHEDGIVCRLEVEHREGDSTKIYYDSRDCVIMQWTGKIDCNGKEIYLYDIVDDNENSPIVVEWDDENAWFCTKDKLMSYAISDYPIDSLKVVGNKYQSNIV